MPKKIQEVTTALKLIQKFSLVGAITPQLDETVVPVVVLDDLSDVQQWDYAFVADGRVGGGLGTFNTWSLENPADSGKVLQLLHWEFSSGISATWLVAANRLSVPLSTAIQPLFQDLARYWAVPVDLPAGDPRHEALVGIFAGFIVLSVELAVDAPWAWRPEQLLIYPDQRIMLYPQAANIEGRMSLRWRERALLPDGS